MKKRDQKAADKSLKTGTNELRSRKFRYLNEQLYTSKSKNAEHIFKEKPQLFLDVSSFDLIFEIDL